MTDYGNISVLRIVDCSVMPVMVADNLDGAVMAMAWHAADIVRAEA